VIVSSRRFAQFGLAAAFVLATACASTLLIVPVMSKPVAVADLGTKAPDFQLNDLGGATFTLSDCRGQAVVLYFCSDESKLSKAYDERVDRLAQDYAADGRVKFFAVNVGDGHASFDPLMLRPNSHTVARSFPTLLDERALVAARYSVKNTPMMVVIDARGDVHYRGAFDNSADLAFATRHLCEEAVRDVLESSTPALASMHK
jgi:cytochrome oxidase Cu insertion factor (SCO1/SenC/PrrC family)